MAKTTKKTLNKSEFQKVYNDTVTYEAVRDVAEYFKVSPRTVNTWAHDLRSEGFSIIDRTVNGKFKPKVGKIKEIRTKKEENLQNKIEEQKTEISKLKELPPLSFDERMEVQKFKNEITSIKKDLREAERQALTSESLMGVIHGTDKHDFGFVPHWLEPNQSKKSTHGIPVLFLSDLHFDEVVDPAQINYVNEYNRDIATKRIQHTFNTTIDLLFNRMVNPTYEGIVVALGGDMLSGNIHDELAETNEDSIQRSLLELTDVLIEGINKLLTKFDKIFIPCVVGNHGRHHKKPRAKNKVFDNYEWLIYQFMNRHFKEDKRVTFLIPDGPDAIFSIYNLSFLLTHGDQFRGGNAIAGIFSPLMLGFHRKQKKQASVNNSFDVMLVGHFHQYVHTNQLVINGSSKGYDEYANQMNFAFERPQQALFIVHPKNGMVMRTPILCDSYKEEGKDDYKKVKAFE